MKHVHSATILNQLCAHKVKSREFPTLLHVEYHAMTDCIQFDMMECVTMQLCIAFECMSMQSWITLEHVTMQSWIMFKHITMQSWIAFV